MKDFFISYNRHDRQWAEWIAWVLEEKGYACILQDWDMLPGSNFVLEMHQAAAEAERTVAVFSPHYLDSVFTQPEWAAAFVQDPTGQRTKLIPVRVRECELSGMLTSIVYIDLVGQDEDDAQRLLLQRVAQAVAQERGKPSRKPVFPIQFVDNETAKPRFPGKLPATWNVPYLRNPNFTGREDILSDIHNALNSGQPAALTQAIVGLGGIGKTQLTLEYAYRYAADYDMIWWLRAEEVETMAGDYAAIAAALTLPEKDLAEQVLIVAAVRRWLEQHAGWLLVFDNAVDPEDLGDFLPRGPAKRILITSRHRDWSSMAHPIAVQTWPRNEATAFLRKRTNQEDAPAAGKLAEALGDLPLALEQAAAYMKASSLSFHKYLSLFTARRAELWQEERPPAAYHQDTVATTWSLALEAVEQTAPLGGKILNLCAYLAPDRIPRSLLDEVGEYLPDDLAALFGDPLAVNKGIQALNHYSLLDIETDMFSIHRLVQAVVQDTHREDAQKMWVEIAVQLITGAYPGDGYHNPQSWPRCGALLPHGQMVVEHSSAHQSGLKDAATLLNKIASYLHGRAAYSEAEPLYRRALEIVEAQLGAEHPITNILRRNLENLLEDIKAGKEK